MSENRDRVDITVPAYDRMSARWKLLMDLLGGTLAMRAASTTWLPKEPAESNDAYKVRLGRTVLYEAFKDSVEKVGNRPFEKPVAIEDAPTELEYLEDNVDGTGRSMTELGRNLLEDMASFGLCHVLVDFTAMPEANEDGTPLTKQQEEDFGARAKFAHIKPTNLIGWRASFRPDGTPVLEQLRIRETHEEPEGLYRTREVAKVRVLTPDGWELHRKNEGNDAGWTKESEGRSTLGRIGLVTVYAERVAHLEADPPMERLGWLNLAHYQSMSDQRNILRFTRFAILFLSGLTDEDMEKPVEIGPTQTIRTTSKDADGKYLEHTGAAIEAGRKDMEELERLMEVLGLTPFYPNTARDVTATAVGVSEKKSSSAIQAWIRALEKGLRECYEIAAEWHGIGSDEQRLPEGFKLGINSDFEIPTLGGSHLDFLLKAVERHTISKRTFLEEVKRRGILSEGIDIEAELAAIEEEGASMADLLVDAGTGDDGGEGGDE